MRLLAVVSLIAVFVLQAGLFSGCGSKSAASSALDSELSYFPADSPFVMGVATDPSSPAIKNAQSLIRSVSFAPLAETALLDKLAQIGINYNEQIRPLFGNPIAFGFTGSSASASSFRHPHPLAVWITKNPNALKSLMSRLTPGFRQAGSHDGATLYASGSLVIAVQGSTLVLSEGLDQMSAALDRHVHGGGITSDEHDRLTSGLPRDPLVQMFGSLRSVLGGRSSARRVPWVAALRGYATSITTSPTGLSFQYKLDTSGAPLSAAQVPLAPGGAPPRVAGTLPIVVAINNPAHLVSFIESAEQLASPGSYASFQARQMRLRSKTGADVPSLFRLLTGNLIIESDTHTTLARGAVSDPALARTTLAKLASDPKDALPGAGISRGPGGLYRINRRARAPVAIGVVNGQLVVGRATPAAIRAFAFAPTSSVAGTRGSAIFRVAIAQLLSRVVHRTQALGKNVLGALGDITGWASATSKATTGNATFSFR